MDELKPPPMPEPVASSYTMEALGVMYDGGGPRTHITPSEELPAGTKLFTAEQLASRDAQWLALVGELQRDAERLRTLYLAVQSDGFGWWTPDWCIKEGETAPTFDQFRSQIDTERSAIDAAMEKQP